MAASMKIVNEWRNATLEKGGALTRTEHSEICERVVERMAERLDECFDHHREWVAQELRLVQSSISDQIGRALKEKNL